MDESVTVWPFALVATSYALGAALGRWLGLRGRGDPRPGRGPGRRVYDNLFALLGLVLGGVVVWFVPHVGHVLFDPPPKWGAVGNNERWAFVGYGMTLFAYPLLMFMLLYYTTARTCADDPPVGGRWVRVLDRLRRTGLRTAAGGAVPGVLLWLAWVVANNAWQTATNRYFTIVCALWSWGAIAAAGRLVDVFLRGTGLRALTLASAGVVLAVGVATASDLPVSQEGLDTGTGELIPNWLAALNQRILAIDPAAVDCSPGAPAFAQRSDADGEAPPLIFVAAAGGGSRAAVYVTLALSLLDRPLAEIASIHDPDSTLYTGLSESRTAYEHVVLMSGVSGGSVGIANFASRHAQTLAAGQGAPAEIGERECSLKNVFCEEIGLPLGPPPPRTFYSIVGRPVVDDMFVDFVAPFMVGVLDPRVGRGERLAQWWREELQWEEGIRGQPAGAVPLLLFNAVVARKGSRVVFGKPAITGELLGNPDDVRPSPQSAVTLQVTGELNVADAVRISASFPFGMDLATVGDEALIDGGVLDNSGTDAIGSVFEGLDQLAVAVGPHQAQARCLVRSLRAHPLVVIEVDSGAKPASIDAAEPQAVGQLMAHSDSITAAMWRRERSAVDSVHATVRRFGQEPSRGSRWIAFPYLPGLDTCRSAAAATANQAPGLGTPGSAADDAVITTWALGPRDKRALVTNFRELVHADQGVVYVDGDCLAPPVPALLDAFVPPEEVPADLRAHRAWEAKPGAAPAPASWGNADAAQLVAMFPSAGAESREVWGNLGPSQQAPGGTAVPLWIPVGAVRGTSTHVLSNHLLVLPPRLEIASTVPRGTLTRPTLAFASRDLESAPVAWLPKGLSVGGKLVQADPGDGSPRVGWIEQSFVLQRAACASAAPAEVRECAGIEPAAGLEVASTLLKRRIFAPACVLVATEPVDCTPWATGKGSPQVIVSVARAQLAVVKAQFGERGGVLVRDRDDPGIELGGTPPPGRAKTPAAPGAKSPLGATAQVASQAKVAAPSGVAVAGSPRPRGEQAAETEPGVDHAVQAPPLATQQVVVTTIPVRLYLEDLSVQAVPTLEGALELMLTLHLLPPGMAQSAANARGGSPLRFGKGKVYRSVEVGDTGRWEPVKVFSDSLALGKSTVIRWDLEDHDLDDDDGQEVSELWVTVTNRGGTAVLECNALDPKVDEVKASGTECHVSTRSETKFTLGYSIVLR